MSNPWQIYDALIEGIDQACGSASDAGDGEITVTSAHIGLQWSRVITSEGGIGMAFSMADKSRPPTFERPTFTGVPLRELASLAKTWNFAEASIGMAAINAFYSHPKRAAAAGFTPSGGASWQHTFDSYAETVAGARVAVIGHFPFAPQPLAAADELYMLERAPHPGDYPDPACEYLLPECDFVFISSSAFVNKTAPRLLELSHAAHTVLVGPSTPLAPWLFDFGVDMLTGFVSTTPERLDAALDGVTMAGMYDAGTRVHKNASLTMP